ncbi:putative acetyl-CoA carboxylase [Lupinus albus]|uniref:acetyl-CoA carboxytransferase n=1 Tax=Lupinus albus TaxID=3870 RepID=A0A6A4R9L5_LUPAL|nr:putative acetyl-CoA carboxylase [Lupinus albus]
MAASAAASLTGASASDLLRSSTSGFSGVPLRTLGRARLALKTRDFAVSCKLRKVKKHEYPWPDNPDPNVKGGVLSHLSPFKPLKEKPKPVTLEFEKPLLDLQKKIIDVRKMANETGLDFSDQILLLESKYQQALKDLYTHLTPIQRVNIARHPNRPTFLDHIFNITEKFVELHGDREGYDDPAIVTGIGTIDGRRYMFIGHQKGRNTKENIQRNFGMPTPHGYRKALRLMEYADHHGFPIVTFIDTPGAYADLKSEELGQGEAIAHNLRSMFGLKVPVLSIVIGEGGSGGALAIACANKLLMLENAVFYVASPEACAAILWKSAKAAPKAAEKLKITATELCKLEIADGVIPEPLGGAHADSAWTSQQIKNAINESMDELSKLSTEELLKHRHDKFRKIGGFQEGIPIDPKRKFSMKKKDIPIPKKISDAEIEAEIQKLKQQILEAKGSSPEPPKHDLGDMIKKLKREVDHEYFEAVKAMGLTDRFSKLREEVTKANSRNQSIDPSLKDKIEKLEAEFDQGLPAAPNYDKLQKKLGMLKELSEVKHLSETNEEAVRLKQKMQTVLDDVLNSPRIKEKYETLKGEIESIGASSPSDLDDAEIEAEIQKLKQQILEAKGSSPEPPKHDLADMIKKLKREVDHEYFEAVKAMGLADRFSKLREEVTKANSRNQSIDPSLKDKIEKLEAEFDQGLPAAPNYDKLQKKLGMLKELSEVKHLSETNEEVVRLKQEMQTVLDDVLNSPRIKEKYETLKGEIESIGASSPSDLDDELKKKIIEFREEVGLQVANDLKTAGIDLTPLRAKPRENSDESSLSEYESKVEELKKDIEKEIEYSVNSSDIKSKIEALNLEVAKAADTPDVDSKNRIAALVQQIKQSLVETLDSSSLKDKYENLVSKVSSENGSLKKADPTGESPNNDDLKVEVATNHTFS